MTALAIARSSLSTSLLRYGRSWGLWLLLLIAPVGARYWIASGSDTSSAIVVNGQAPVLTSAMLGVSLGIITSTLLLPAAFIYLRANATRRQPWQVEEVTGASRVAIALGRFVADVAVLGAVLTAMTLAGWLLAWLLAPVDGVRIVDITLGLWLIAAPALMGVAAVRILFDALRFTRGPLGEVLFFFLWIFSIAAPSINAEGNASFAGNMSDFAGFIRPLSYALPQDRRNDFAIGAAPMGEGRISLDVMSGLMSEGYVASRLAWAGIAVLIAAFAGLAYRPHRPRATRRGTGRIARLLSPGAPPPAQHEAPAAPFVPAPLAGLIAAEFRLIAEGRIWLLLALGAAVLGWIADFRTVANPAALLLLIFGLTAHAGRSEQPKLLALTGTMQLPPMVRRAAFIIAGTGWSLLLALPAILRAGLAGSTDPAILALATGAIASAAAILLSAISRSAFAPRLILLIAWYAWLSTA